MGLTGEGTEVIQFTCHGGSNQRWTVESLGQAGARIINVMSGKCLGTRSRSGSDHVAEFSCDGSLGQVWTFRNDGNGYVVQNVATRRCLDVMGAATADGTNLIAWRCTGALNQTWLYGSNVPP